MRAVPLRLPVLVLSLGALPAVPSAAPQEPAAAPSRPGIVLIVVDDQGYADLGCVEGSQAETPGIDRLAAEGVRFRQAYVTAPMCSPSRAGILTGRYPERFGYYRNGQSKRGLPGEEVTLAEALKGAGYATGLVGKWHLGERYDRHPIVNGFDEFFGFLGAWHGHYPENVSGYPTSLMRGRERLTFTGYLNEILTQEAVSFLERHAEEDFFLYLSYGLLHTPLESPPGWRVDREDRRHTYLGMLAELDRSVARVLKALDDTGRAADTLVLYLSDNGGGEGNGAVNEPLRGYKLSLHEGGIRVPFLVRWPAVLPAGKVVDEPVLALDAYATCLTAAGLAVPASPRVDGADLVPLVLGREASLHPELFWRLEDDRWATRSGPWKLVEEGGERALYDLVRDPGETRSLLEDEPEVVARLSGAFARWAADLPPPPEEKEIKRGDRER